MAIPSWERAPLLRDASVLSLDFQSRKEGQKARILTLAGDDSEQVVDQYDKPLGVGVAPQGIHQERDNKTAPRDLRF